MLSYAITCNTSHPVDSLSRAARIEREGTYCQLVGAELDGNIFLLPLYTTIAGRDYIYTFHAAAIRAASIDWVKENTEYHQIGRTFLFSRAATISRPPSNIRLPLFRGDPLFQNALTLPESVYVFESVVSQIAADILPNSILYFTEDFPEYDPWIRTVYRRALLLDDEIDAAQFYDDIYRPALSAFFRFHSCDYLREGNRIIRREAKPPPHSFVRPLPISDYCSIPYYLLRCAYAYDRRELISATLRLHRIAAQVSEALATYAIDAHRLKSLKSPRQILRGCSDMLNSFVGWLSLII